MSGEFSSEWRAAEAWQVLRTEVTMSPIQVLFLLSLTTPPHPYLHNQELQYFCQAQVRSARSLPGAQGLGWAPGSPSGDICLDDIVTRPHNSQSCSQRLLNLLKDLAQPYPPSEGAETHSRGESSETR